MNWRMIVAVLAALGLRAVAVSRLGWSYRPFRDSFRLLEFGRDAALFLFILAMCLAVITAIFPRQDTP